MSPLPFADIATITQDENVLILTARPWEVAWHCGGLIARSVRRGRPPIVMVLGDGTSSHPGWPQAPLADRHAADTRAAMTRLQLDIDRVLMAGVFDARLADDMLFGAIVAAVIQVMWRTDCNIVCAPIHGDAMAQTVHDVARSVAAGSGVGHLVAGGDAGWQLDITDDLAAKHVACATHTLSPVSANLRSTELYCRLD